MTQTVPDSKPGFSEAEAAELAIVLFGITATAQPLPSERDQNFLLQATSQDKFILKISHAAESKDILDAQQAALDHLAHHAPSLACPRVLPTLAGDTVGVTQDPLGRSHYVRLLSFVPGHLLVHMQPHSSALLVSLGMFFGRLDRALKDFSHPALWHRQLDWDLRHAHSVITQNLDHLANAHQRSLVEWFLMRFAEQCEPILPTLRTSVIHNDGNDYNVLVTGDPMEGGKVTGVVDFGDLVVSCTIFELAICAAYATLGKPNPITAAAHVVRGYHSVNPLTEQEIALLYDLMAARLCTSVVLCARQKKAQPENPYLSVSEAPAWAALEHLRQVDPRWATCVFRQACGFEVLPQAIRVTQWLTTHAEQLGPIMLPDIRVPGRAVVFDLTPGSPDFLQVEDLADIDRWTAAFAERIHAQGAQVGIGRYNEPRRSYTGDAYRRRGPFIEDWRTIHLGLDIFAPPGTPVLAPLAGTVHSVQDNPDFQDYGPTVILRHEPEKGMVFFTLYGHLSHDTLQRLTVGQPVEQGAVVGTVGTPQENGHWPPHVHVQLILDMFQHAGTFPGVCSAQERALWLALCPDPNLILRLPVHSDAGDAEPNTAAILADRNQVLGPSLHLSYREPLHLVRGWMQYVYDSLGREYLDAINNVCHVGHCHPSVVTAAHRQMALLNTNTRYLHELIVQYAKRLCATLPDPLRVCFFVCSGSEANELALRLAQAHTGGTEVIVVDGGYHGNTTSLVNISPYKFHGPGGMGAPPHVHTLMMPDRYRGPYKDPETAGHLYALQIKTIIEYLQRSHRTLCAFICESMLSCGGQIVLPPRYLSHIYHAVREAGGICIADEVQVGFGRVGTHFWGFQTQDVIPDIVTMGKPIGNGHPLAAVITTPDIARSFANGMEYFNTFGGNPVSCAVGLAVLDVLETQHLQANALHTGSYLKTQLSTLQAKHPLIGDVRGEGLFLGVELVRDPHTLEPAGREASYVVERMKECGVLVSADGPYRNVLKIKPPLVFTTADADRLVDTLDRVLAEPRLSTLSRTS